MTAITLNIDWLTTALAASGNQTLDTQTRTTNDWRATALTDSSVNGGRAPVDLQEITVHSWTGVSPYYKMRGMDQSVDGTYDTWVVQGQPDFTAAKYTGSLNLPLRDVCVVDMWQA